MSLNSVKEEDRLTALKIIQKRYSFLFEDFWFILLQYFYFEKFVISNAIYLEQRERNSKELNSKPISYTIIVDGHYIMKHWALDANFGFMTFNLILTALVGLGGLTTIPYCFKMIKQGKPKTKAFYILTFIQILLQTIFPFMRAGIVIYRILDALNVGDDNSHCILVGFQVLTLRKFKRF